MFQVSNVIYVYCKNQNDIFFLYNTAKDTNDINIEPVLNIKYPNPNTIRTGIIENVITFFRGGLYLRIRIEYAIELKNPQTMGAISFFIIYFFKLKNLN